MARKSGFLVNPLSIKNISTMANSLRKSFRLEDVYRIEPMGIIEILAGSQLLNYEIVPDQEWDNANGEAYYDPLDETIYIPELLYELSLSGDGRARFTIAHELGHWFLKHKPKVARNADIEPIYKDSEWQADTFASHLLAPPHLAKTCTSTEEIQQTFGISESSAKIVLKNAKKANSQ